MKQGKIKKQKPLPEISEEEKPFELPEGWEWTTLTRIAEINPKIDVSDDEQEISFIPMPLISTKFDGSHEFEIKKWKDVKKGYTHFANGDIAIAKITPCFENSKAAIFSGLKNGIGVGTTELHVARPFSDIINRKYLLLNFKSPNFLKSGESQMTGSAGQKRVPRLFFENNPIPFPPLQEQERIIIRFTQLMSLCDQLEQQSLTSLDAHQQLVETLLGTLTDSQNAEELAENWARISEHFDTLFTTEASVDALKQTILQLAVMGKLVPQDPNDEPASELLKRIAHEKAQLVKEGKIKKQKPLPPISDEEKPFELPEGWEWCRLGDLALKSEAGWSPQCENEPRSGNQWGVLKISAVTWGEYRPQENKALPEHLLPRQEYEVKENDFLISRANTSELVARSVVVPENPPINLMLSDKIIRFEFSSFANPYYINLVNNSVFSRKYYKDVAGGTSSSMKNVSRNQVSELVIALPCYKEQLKITETLKQYMKICEELSSQIQSAQQTQLHLADALTDVTIN